MSLQMGSDKPNKPNIAKTKFECKYLYRGTCAAILILVSTVIFSLVWLDFVRVNNQTGHLLGIGNIGMAVGIYGILFFLLGQFIGAFRIGVDRKASLMAACVLTAFTVDFIEIFLSLAITGQFRFFVSFLGRYALLFMIQSVILCILLIPMINIYRKAFPPLRIMEVHGDRKHGLHSKINGIEYKYSVVDMIHYTSGIEEIRKRMNAVDAVLISDIPSHEKNMIQKACVDQDKRLYFVPKISDIIVRYSEELNVIDTPLFLRRKIGISLWERFIKRAFDILASVVALVILSPVFLITALAIKLEDGGPVFYRQERLTKNGKRFMLMKFRSMRVDAESDGVARLSSGEDDPRITSVGRFLRKCRLDELPQLINILLGHMSLCGPRPERPEIAAQYEQILPEFNLRLQAKAGLTGYAQVYGKYNTTPYDKLLMDLVYIAHPSLLEDVRILFATVKVLFIPESTEGIRPGQETAIPDIGKRED